MKYTIYNSNGQIVSVINVITDQDHTDNLNGKDFIEGHYNDQEHYIDTNTKTVISKPTQPSSDHDWDWNSKSWQLNSQRSVDSVRQQRDGLLSAIDRVNPVWYASLTSEQQQELQTYRQQLLDVPQQAEFPSTIEWPTKPTWL